MGIFPMSPGQEPGSLWNNFRFHTPAPLAASESRGLESESFPATCHRDRQQFLDAGGSTASGWGCGGWLCGTLCFWLRLVEMFPTCFPVFTERGWECSLWPRSQSDRAWPLGSGKNGTSKAERSTRPRVGAQGLLPMVGRVLAGSDWQPAEGPWAGTSQSEEPSRNALGNRSEHWPGCRRPLSHLVPFAAPLNFHSLGPLPRGAWSWLLRVAGSQAAQCLQQGSLPGLGGPGEVGTSVLWSHFPVQLLLQAGHLGKARSLVRWSCGQWRVARAPAQDVEGWVLQGGMCRRVAARGDAGPSP